jgi:hypothetical protein
MRPGDMLKTRSHVRWIMLTKLPVGPWGARLGDPSNPVTATMSPNTLGLVVAVVGDENPEALILTNTSELGWGWTNSFDMVSP